MGVKTCASTAPILRWKRFSASSPATEAHESEGEQRATRFSPSLLFACSRPLLLALHKLPNVLIHQRGMLVDNPVRAIGNPLDREIRDKLLQPIEVARKQRPVLLSPDDKRWHTHRQCVQVSARPLLGRLRAYGRLCS